MQLGPKSLMVIPKVVDLSLIFRDSREQLRVSLLPGQEPVHNLIDVGEPCSSPNLLEGIFDGIVSIHFLLHLLFEEGGEESVDQELVSHLDFILVLVLIGCHIGDLLLSTNSVHSSLQGLLLVLD